MSKLWVVVVAGLGCAACSSSSTTGTGTSGGTTGTVDAGETCNTVDAGCTAQADCDAASQQSRGGVETYACVSGACALQATRDNHCFAESSVSSITVQLPSNFNVSSIKSFEVWAFYGTRADGSSLTCGDVTGRSAFDDGGNPLDTDAALNVQDVGGYKNTASSGSTPSLAFSLLVDTAPLVLVQAYDGQPDVTNHVTGSRIAEGCTAAPTITSASQTIAVNVQ